VSPCRADPPPAHHMLLPSSSFASSTLWSAREWEGRAPPRMAVGAELNHHHMARAEHAGGVSATSTGRGARGRGRGRQRRDEWRDGDAPVWALPLARSSPYPPPRRRAWGRSSLRVFVRRPSAAEQPASVGASERVPEEETTTAGNSDLGWAQPSCVTATAGNSD
jgi:hypothetical protein